MAEYKTKEVSFDVDGDTSMKKIFHLLPELLRDNDEPGWEVCSTVVAQFNTKNPVTIGIVYRKL